MPSVVNITPVAGMGQSARSLRCWLHASNSDLTEVALAACRYLVFDAYPNTNAGGALIGRGVIDAGDLPAVTRFNGAASVQELLNRAFGD